MDDRAHKADEFHHQQIPPTSNNASSTTDNNAPSNDRRSGVFSRILRKGDLVRILGSKDPRVKGREGALGRILQSRPIPQQDLDAIPQSSHQFEHHPFLYDLELILGGRLSSVHRKDILHTTAEAEGMTADANSMRARRKRKPSSIILETQEQAEEVNKPTKKKTKGGKGKGRTNGAKTIAAKAASKNGAKDTKRKSAGKSSSSHGASKKTKPSDCEVPKNDDAFITKDLYEKHRRDLDKALIRLEKLDSFGFFLEQPAAVSGTQQYATNKSSMKTQALASEKTSVVTSSGSASDETKGVQSSPQSASLPPDGPDVAKEPAESVANPPETPPYTWQHLKTRRDEGHYVLDRIQKSQKERSKRLGPYVWYKRKNRMKEGNSQAAATKNDTQPDPQKTKTKIKLVNQNGTRLHPRVVHPRGVDWDKFRADLYAMCDVAIARNPGAAFGKPGTLGYTTAKIKEVMELIYEKTGRRQMREMDLADASHEFNVLIRSTENVEAAMQVDWRREPFPERKYERLTSDVICAGLSELDAMSASNEMRTSLSDSFVSTSYYYNDTGQSEGWMKSILDGNVSNSDDNEAQAARALAADRGVVRAQVRATMASLLVSVQDKVLTEGGVLNDPELRSANWDDGDTEMPDGTANPIDAKPDLVEQSVWGIDCYTRRNIIICLEKDFDQDTAVNFVEKWLLPAINACPVDMAHDMSNAAKLLEGLPLQSSTENNEKATQKLNRNKLWSHTLIGKALLDKIKAGGPPWLKAAAFQLRRAVESIGHDFFRVHPKGHGSIVLSSVLKANTLVTYYRGEIYPSWRWGEKLDAIEMTQEYLGLRPDLPDFYNMALERPRKDPRGYGLLIVDASRKAGHGSMLSHSCDPTCEVRVAALNGELCLAMTTLRDIEQGEELTFDYNAVTESVAEYRAAVCLCGYRKCRGSFLHFATADCYQQVLNRNSPIAVRFSNLAKGSSKRVMREEDEKLLEGHGFGTAAFGGVSFNRRPGHGTPMDAESSVRDVPVWLKTYVADILRYIEYERRALPVALVCNHFESQAKNPSGSSNNGRSKQGSASKTQQRKPKDRSNEGRASTIKVFQYFFSKNKDSFLETVKAQRTEDLEGFDLQCTLKKVAGSAWRTLDETAKQQWKQECEKHDSTLQPGAPANKPAVERSGDGSQNGQEHAKLTKGKTKNGTNGTKDASNSNDLNLAKISFEAADAEGISAMGQRIQQLTQTLSRVGRVLDRHRKSRLTEWTLESSFSGSSLYDIDPPLSVLMNEEVISWVWNHTDGPVHSLFRSLEGEAYAGPGLLGSLQEIRAKHKSLESFGHSSWSGEKLSPSRGRESLRIALLELRQCLVSGAQQVSFDIRSQENERSRLRARARREAKEMDKNKDLHEVASVLQGIVDEVAEEDIQENLQGFPAGHLSRVLLQCSGAATSCTPNTSDDANRLNRICENRWKLEAAADILLMYAYTSTFFKLKPYKALESTPIEVYARELGNKVPRNRIKLPEGTRDSIQNAIVLVADDSAYDSDSDPPSLKRRKQRGRRDLCDPEETIAKVAVSYDEDYVLSQLLQWYNGGIGQKPGLPDMLGCVTLPCVASCFESEAKFGGRPRNSTKYQTQVRPELLEWFKDPRKRGVSFKGDLRECFGEPKPIRSGNRPMASFFGSPVLDLLVAGDDSSLNSVVAALQEDFAQTTNHYHKVESASSRLQSTVDEGMPVQAVANWVQCENPACLKWRKVPWHIDVDLLPEKFFCKDNFWNPAAASCKSPEDAWDESDATRNQASAPAENKTPVDDEKRDSGFSFAIGERYDVRRLGKDKFCTAVVVKVELEAEKISRVKFHFPKVPEKFDEWVQLPSARIAPHFSKQNVKTEKVKNDRVKGDEKRDGDNKEDNESDRPKVSELTTMKKKPVANSEDNTNGVKVNPGGKAAEVTGGIERMVSTSQPTKPNPSSHSSFHVQRKNGFMQKSQAGCLDGTGDPQSFPSVPPAGLNSGTKTNRPSKDKPDVFREIRSGAPDGSAAKIKGSKVRSPPQDGVKHGAVPRKEKPPNAPPKVWNQTSVPRKRSRNANDNDIESDNPVMKQPTLSDKHVREREPSSQNKLKFYQEGSKNPADSGFRMPRKWGGESRIPRRQPTESQAGHGKQRDPPPNPDKSPPPGQYLPAKGGTHRNYHAPTADTERKPTEPRIPPEREPATGHHPLLGARFIPRSNN